MNYLRELHCDNIHSWGNSAPLRSAVAVLRKNHPLTYQKEVMGICDVDESMISPQIELRNIDNYLLNQYKRTPKARKIKNKMRVIERKNHKSKEKGDYGFKHDDMSSDYFN